MEELHKEEQKTDYKDKLKGYLIGLGVVLFLLYGFYTMFFKLSDEIGFLGAGKVGRQVMLQTLDNYMKPTVRVDSDFHDRPFIARMIVGEPLRTTLRFDIQDEQKFLPDVETTKKFMDQPHQMITDEYKGDISLQEEFDLNIDEFRELMNKKNVKTLEDFFAGMGFKTLQIYVKGEPKVTLEIRGNENVKHVGGD